MKHIETHFILFSWGTQKEKNDSRDILEPKLLSLFAELDVNDDEKVATAVQTILKGVYIDVDLKNRNFLLDFDDNNLFQGYDTVVILWGSGKDWILVDRNMKRSRVSRKRKAAIVSQSSLMSQGPHAHVLVSH